MTLLSSSALKTREVFLLPLSQCTYRTIKKLLVCQAKENITCLLGAWVTWTVRDYSSSLLMQDSPSFLIYLCEISGFSPEAIKFYRTPCKGLLY